MPSGNRAIAGAIVPYLFAYILTLHSIITPFEAFKISYIFEDIMENGAFALLEQMLHFP